MYIGAMKLTIQLLIGVIGNGTATNFGICAVTESWANFFGMYSMYYKYGESESIWLEQLDKTLGNDQYAWFPEGVYWDLFDDEAMYSAYGTGGEPYEGCPLPGEIVSLFNYYGY